MSQSTSEFLENYVIQTVKNALKKYGNDGSFEIHPFDVPPGSSESFAEHMSIILLWSEIGSMTLKTHFSLLTSQRLTARVLGRPVDQISERSAMDFMREFNNMVGGRLRGDFEKNQILIGMSLPFLTRGEDEVVFRNIRDPRSKCRVWKLKSPENELYFSTEVCLVDGKPIDAARSQLEAELQKKDQDAPDGAGEVDFF